jgi:transcriptional regulator with XRE-family HTH domain
VTQNNINQRLKILIEQLEMSIRAFSNALDVSESTTRNYLERGTKPSSDYLEKIVRHFNRVNPTWLLIGDGEPFVANNQADIQSTNITTHKTKGNIQNNTGKNAKVAKHVTLEDCKRNLETSQREVEQLKALLAAKDEVIAAKEEMLSLLRAGHNRPN